MLTKDSFPLTFFFFKCYQTLENTETIFTQDFPLKKGACYEIELFSKLI